ncbi:MAG: orotidine-5'-phosphate decarboxylase [Gaiellaceae bacterium]|jgi:orotidine-5'-phosphate decarboxylase
MEDQRESVPERELALPTFGDRLAEAVEQKRSQLVVGLDPRLELLPLELRGEAQHSSEGIADAFSRFCRAVVDAVAPYVVCVKPQLAFFELYGSAGLRALEEVCAHARDSGLLVIADAKRSDIGSTARAYAGAYLEPRGTNPPLADALTVNPYLGRDALEPFLLACQRHGGGVFTLLKTSNPGSSDLQDLMLSDGRPVWHHLALLLQEPAETLVGSSGLSSLGVVVGATYPRVIGEARRLLPRSIILLPGIGAQGASPADVARAFTSGPASALVNASRSVIFAYRAAEEIDWREASGREAARLRDEIWAASGW